MVLEHYLKAAKELGLDVDKIYVDMAKLSSEKSLPARNERRCARNSNNLTNSYSYYNSPNTFLRKWRKRMRDFHKKGIVYQSLQKIANSLT